MRRKLQATWQFEMCVSVCYMMGTEIFEIGWEIGSTLYNRILEGVADFKVIFIFVTQERH